MSASSILRRGPPRNIDPPQSLTLDRLVGAAPSASRVCGVRFNATQITPTTTITESSPVAAFVSQNAGLSTPPPQSVRWAGSCTGAALLRPKPARSLRLAPVRFSSPPPHSQNRTPFEYLTYKHLLTYSNSYANMSYDRRAQTRPSHPNLPKANIHRNYPSRNCLIRKDFHTLSHSPLTHFR
jgi:hypothetical protein